MTQCYQFRQKMCGFLERFLKEREALLGWAFTMLRTEEEANLFCQQREIGVGTTATQSADHHQSSKALVAAVTSLSVEVCHDLGISIDPNPQTRCVWCAENVLHVTARNLDGAVPGLGIPNVIWRIKEDLGQEGAEVR